MKFLFFSKPFSNSVPPHKFICLNELTKSSLCYGDQLYDESVPKDQSVQPKATVFDTKTEPVLARPGI